MSGGIEIVTLFSGSKGNCVYLRSGDSRILIDAGRTLSAIDKALRLVDTSIDRINAIVVTHEHSDHVSALGSIMSKYRIPVHMTELTAQAYLGKYSPSYSTIVTHPTVYSVKVGELEAVSFSTPHDSADSVGYIISSAEEHIGYATDMGCPTKQVLEQLCICSKVIIESNYDEEMLLKGSYPEFLKSRIRSSRGHLSNEGCATLVTHLARRGVKGFILAHLSENNNLPELALKTSCNALCSIGATDTEIIVADGKVPTRF